MTEQLVKNHFVTHGTKNKDMLHRVCRSMKVQMKNRSTANSQHLRKAIVDCYRGEAFEQDIVSQIMGMEEQQRKQRQQEATQKRETEKKMKNEEDEDIEANLKRGESWHILQGCLGNMSFRNEKWSGTCNDFLTKEVSGSALVQVLGVYVCDGARTRSREMARWAKAAKEEQMQKRRQKHRDVEAWASGAGSGGAEGRENTCGLNAREVELQAQLEARQKAQVMHALALSCGFVKLQLLGEDRPALEQTYEKLVACGDIGALSRIRRGVSEDERASLVFYVVDPQFVLEDEEEDEDEDEQQQEEGAKTKRKITIHEPATSDGGWCDGGRRESDKFVFGVDLLI